MNHDPLITRSRAGFLAALIVTSAFTSSLAWPEDDTDASRASAKPESIFEFLLASYDEDGDGEVSREEYLRDDAHWERLDLNRDGALTAVDFAGRPRRGRPEPGSRGRGTTPESARPPKAGDPAPDFDLEVIVLPKREGEDGAGEGEKPDESKPGTVQPGKEEQARRVTLSGFAKKERPVALIFGSYT